MGAAPDYAVLAAEVLGIRNAPPALAKRLVDQALVVEDRREAWLATGARLCAAAPPVPGVYVLRDASGRALYVGKANHIRRRLQTHFAARRWRHLKPEFARAASVEWHEVGSEIEALLLEAEWIGALAPLANVQVSVPALDRRAIPAALLRDTLLVLPSAVEGAVELLAATRGRPGAAATRVARGEGASGARRGPAAVLRRRAACGDGAGCPRHARPGAARVLVAGRTRGYGDPARSARRAVGARAPATSAAPVGGHAALLRASGHHPLGAAGAHTAVIAAAPGVGLHWRDVWVRNCPAYTSKPLRALSSVG